MFLISGLAPYSETEYLDSGNVEFSEEFRLEAEDDGEDKEEEENEEQSEDGDNSVDDMEMVLQEKGENYNSHFLKKKKSYFRPAVVAHNFQQ